MERRFDQLYPATATLLVAILGMFLLEFAATAKLVREGAIGHPGSFAISGLALDLLGWLSAADVRGGEYWRLLSCTFLHANIVHLAFNGYFLFHIGQLCEPSFGRWRYVTVYTSSGIGSSLASMTFSGGASVGASGALCGLGGYLLAHAVRYRDNERRDMLIQWVIWMVLISVIVPQIDQAGHAGGFVTGAVFGALAGRYTTSDSARRWKIPGWVSAALLAASVAWAIYHYLTRDFGL